MLGSVFGVVMYGRGEEGQMLINVSSGDLTGRGEPIGLRANVVERMMACSPHVRRADAS